MLQIAKLGNRKYPHIVQRTEEGGKKHDLGENKPAHAPAERIIHLLVEFAALTFPGHRAKPDKNHVEEYGRIQFPANHSPAESC